jgi:1-aminocyclopropane-1-carboxylate deaminase
VIKIARNTAEIVELGREITGDDVILENAYAGERYGVPTHATLEAIKLAARLEGMITDPVYEGKSMAGLIDLVRQRAIPETAKVLYVHLGGAPALSAYGALFT